MNNKNSILLIDPAFDPSSSTHCSLLVKVGMDNFSYAIINNNTKKISAVFDEQECEDAIKRWGDRLKSDAYLNLSYGEIKLAIYSENNISIPNSLFNSDALSLNGKFFTQPPGHHLYTTAHANFDFTSVFSFSKQTDDIINQNLIDSKKYHANASLLKMAESSVSNSLLLDFTAGSIQILYKKSEQIVFQKCYETENIEEFNYYVLLVINQFAIDINDTAVCVSGIIHQDDEKYNCLKQYFKQITFLEYRDVNLDLEVLEDMPSHYYTSLLALNQCE